MENPALVNGFMIAAAAFITIAGIILAIDHGERLGSLASGSLLLSLIFGTLLIIMALHWLDEPSDSMWFGWFLISVQLFTFYLPMSKLLRYHRSIPGGEKMTSEKNQRLTEEEINTKMDCLANQYMQKYIPNATVDNFENLAIAFTYKHTVNLINATKNLVKETEKLKCLTIALFVATCLLLVAAIIGIVTSCQ